MQTMCNIIDGETDGGSRTPVSSVRLSLMGFMLGKLTDDESPRVSPHPPSPSSMSTSSFDEGLRVSAEASAGDVPLAALAQAKAAQDLLGRDPTEEKRRLKMAAKRDSDIAKDIGVWKRYGLPGLTCPLPSLFLCLFSGTFCRAGLTFRKSCC